MSAKIIDGRALAARSRAQTATRVQAFVAAHGYAPGLATVLVGEDPASHVYVESKRTAAAGIGLADIHHKLPQHSSLSDICAVIDRLATDAAVSGILLQLPLPAAIDASAALDRIPALKDVDGLTTTSQGRLARGVPGMRPCTPSGVIDLLDYAGVPIEGARAVVVGHSPLVGHPTAELLLRRHATVTIAHEKTRELADVTSQADILVVATGVAGLITARHVKPGAAVIDVGITRTPSGLRGDVRHAEVAKVAGWLSPVPGGVGPMTIASLLSNTVTAAEFAAAQPRN